MTVTYEALRSPAQKEIDQRVLGRVKRGMALLQEVYGDDWVEQINANRLDLSSSSECVLGQVYGEYETGLDELWGPDGIGDGHRDRAIDHGFLEGSRTENYPRLTETWRHVLTPQVTSR
jgi:hypothetical protein